MHTKTKKICAKEIYEFYATIGFKFIIWKFKAPEIGIFSDQKTYESKMTENGINKIIILYIILIKLYVLFLLQL